MYLNHLTNSIYRSNPVPGLIIHCTTIRKCPSIPILKATARSSPLMTDMAVNTKSKREQISSAQILDYIYVDTENKNSKISPSLKTRGRKDSYFLHRRKEMHSASGAERLRQQPPITRWVIMQKARRHTS